MPGRASSGPGFRPPLPGLTRGGRGGRGRAQGSLKAPRLLRPAVLISEGGSVNQSECSLACSLYL